jgi:TatD DNase family protein
MISYVNIHTHHFSNNGSIEVKNFTIQEFQQLHDTFKLNENEQFISIGIHPWYFDEEKLANQLQILESQSYNTRCIMIGECGLDKMCATDFELQKKVFIQQIVIAEKIKKPLIIHCVNAYNDIIQIKKRMQPIQPWIIHGFNKRGTILNDLLKNDFYISIGAAIFSSKTLVENLKLIPLDRLLFENDDKEIGIDVIFAEASKILKINVSDLQLQIYSNFIKLRKSNG